MRSDSRFSEDPDEFRKQLGEVRHEVEGQTPEQAIAQSDKLHEETKAGIIRDAEEFAAIGPQRPHNLALSGTGVQRVLFEAGGADPLKQLPQVQLLVRIGEEPANETYVAMDGDLEFDEEMQSLVLRLPDSIAETFRQQGRRRKLRAIRRELEL